MVVCRSIAACKCQSAHLYTNQSAVTIDYHLTYPVKLNPATFNTRASLLNDSRRFNLLFFLHVTAILTIRLRGLLPPRSCVEERGVKLPNTVYHSSGSLNGVLNAICNLSNSSSHCHFCDSPLIL
jgi:hypothetical protein